MNLLTQKCQQKIPVAGIIFLNGLGQIISLDMLFLVIAVAIFSDVSFAIGPPKLDYDFRGLGSTDGDIQSVHPHKKTLKLKYRFALVFKKLKSKSKTNF